MAVDADVSGDAAVNADVGIMCDAVDAVLRRMSVQDAAVAVDVKRMRL